MEALAADSHQEILTRRLILSETISMHHVDEETLLYDERTKKYYILGKLAVELLAYLQKTPVTGHELIRVFSEKLGVGEGQITRQVSDFLNEMLRSSVLLDYDERASEEYVWQHSLERPVSFKPVRVKALLKVFRYMGMDRLIQSVASAIPAGRMTVYMATGFSLCAIAVMFYTLNQHYVELLSGFEWLLMLPFLLLHLIGHELFHAVVAARLGGHIREAGIGLLYFVIPVGYVDLTDTYQLERRKRAAIALAGPLFDLGAIALTCSVVWFMDGFYEQLAVHILLLQFFIFALNCNVLIPSDLLRALENKFKLQNLRKHSFEYLRCVLLQQEKPAHLRKIQGIRENLYLMYALLSVLYILSLVMIVIFMYARVLAG